MTHNPSQPAYGLGHNNGPTMEKGRAWRRHCWTKARKSLLPQMPLEIVRIRMKRARELGLDYKTYATVRATTGGDIIAFLFSTNALRLHRAQDRLTTGTQEKLSTLISADTLLAAHPPLRPAEVASTLGQQGVPVAAAIQAPGLNMSWSEMKARFATLTQDKKLKPGGVLVIGETALEREWVTAGRFAGFLTSDRYFTPRDVTAAAT